MFKAKANNFIKPDSKFMAFYRYFHKKYCINTESFLKKLHFTSEKFV